MTGSFGTVGHLTRRFFASLWPGGPGAPSEAWARSCLSETEQALWSRMSGPDRRHGVAVARRLDAAERVAIPAALLHDVGKVESGLGPIRRAAVTAAALAAGRTRAARGKGRMARYLGHDRLGAELLAGAGSAELTVAWAREHHLPHDRWTVPPALGRALKAADDD